jgi:anti-sigma B factor antagonist
MAHLVRSGAGDSKDFRVELSSASGQGLVRFTGDLDMATASKVTEALQMLVSARVRAAVMDLRGLTFMDSTGLCAVLDADRIAREHSISLRFIEGPGNVQRVFEVTGVTDRLEWTSMGVLRAVSE